MQAAGGVLNHNHRHQSLEAGCDPRHLNNLNNLHTHPYHVHHSPGVQAASGVLTHNHIHKLSGAGRHIHRLNILNIHPGQSPCLFR